METSLGRHWQTGSFSGSFSGAKKSQNNCDSSYKFTLSFMEKLQHKVQSNESRKQSVDTTELQQSLQRSFTNAESNTESEKQIFDEEVEETVRQLLNPVAGDADDLASQIVDRIPDDILGLLNMKLISSKSLPISVADPLESARAIILEVLVNAISLELLDDDRPSASKVPINTEGLNTPSLKKEPTSPAKRKLLPMNSTRQESTERPESSSDVIEPASAISTQLLFSQLTTTIAHAVIEKLNMEATRSPLTTIDSESVDDPPFPFPDDDSNNAPSGDPDATPDNDDTNHEYEEHVMVVTYGSFVGAPNDKNGM